MSDDQHQKFLQRAIELAVEGVQHERGGPFGAVVVKDGEIVGEGSNHVTSGYDPTAHAEIVAMRRACEALKSFQLKGCTLYTSCEPCPMCLGAIYWARPDRIFYACRHSDAAKVGFDDSFIYEELRRPVNERRIPAVQMLREEGLAAFRAWEAKGDRIDY
jgi:tRNA(Arg) A34 adenosine deaminase TadA